MCQTDRVVATSREPPIDNLLVVDHFLCVDPVQQTRPLPVRARRISLCCWRVTCARDLDDDSSTALHGPSMHPSGQFGPVAIKPGENKDAWGFVASRGSCWDAQGDLNCVTFAGDGVFVWKTDIVDWGIHHAVPFSVLFIRAYDIEP